MGKIKNFIDSLVHDLLNSIADSFVEGLKNDPEIEKAVEDFEKSKKELESKLQDFADNPEKYISDEATEK